MLSFADQRVGRPDTTHERRRRYRCNARNNSNDAQGSGQQHYGRDQNRDSPMLARRLTFTNTYSSSWITF